MTITISQKHLNEIKNEWAAKTREELLAHFDNTGDHEYVCKGISKAYKAAYRQAEKDADENNEIEGVWYEDWAAEQVTKQAIDAVLAALGK